MEFKENNNINLDYNILFKEWEEFNLFTINFMEDKDQIKNLLINENIKDYNNKIDAKYKKIKRKK